MKKVIFIAFVTSLSFQCGRTHPWPTQNLNPVHGLFVKPSSDGTTGDLYVAASEDSGVKSQWIADQAINFLPVGAATQTHPTSFPLAYPPPPPPPPLSALKHHDNSATQKRTEVSNPIPTLPIQYAYAMPAPSSIPTESNTVASYPFTFPFPFNPIDHSATKCDSTATIPQYPLPYQFPFQLFYPQMMSAYTNAMSILKDVGLNEDTASAIMGNAAPMWPPTPYAYPMYVMVDPNVWTQSQATAISSTPTTASSSDSSSENS